MINTKHLTDAGYNVLTYDIRNHGNSSAANGGLSGIGQWEWRDCVGLKKYVDSHPTQQDESRPLQSVYGRQLAVPPFTVAPSYSQTCAVW